MLNRIRMIISIVIGLTLTLQHTAAAAQAFPEVEVYGEEDDASNTSCSASHTSAVATVQAALRSNNIVIAKQDKHKAMKAYVNINAMKLTSLCVVYLSLELKSNQVIKHNYSGKDFFATILYCKKGVIISGGPSYIYSTMLDLFRDMTNQCVSEYYKQLDQFSM